MKLLLALLRNALWGVDEIKTKELSFKMAKHLFKLADEQTVCGLIVDALIQNDVKMPQRFVLEAIGIEEKTQQTNREINEELKRLVKLPLKDFIVVKGQTIAALYPNPLLRMPGDIDFLVYDYEKAKEILHRKWSVRLPAKLIDREYAFEHRGAIYEIHDNLFVFSSKKHQCFWNNLMNRPCGYVDIDGVQVPTLAPTINAVYVFVHLFFHLLREGISLRQFCDWAIVIHHYQDKIDRKQLCEIVNKLDLNTAYCALGTIIIEELGLPITEFPLNLSRKDRKWKEKILKDIFEGGNFGKLHHHNYGSLRFKLETLRIVVRNSFRYFMLCPSEAGGMIPKLVMQNIRLFINREII